VVADQLIAVAHNRLTVLARWRQCAHPSNTRFLEPIPMASPSQTASRSIQPFLHGRYYSVHSPNTLHCATPSSKIAFSPGGDLDPHLIYRSLSLPDLPPQSASRSRRPIFYNTRSFTNYRHYREADRPSNRDSTHLHLYSYTVRGGGGKLHNRSNKWSSSIIAVVTCAVGQTSALCAAPTFDPGRAPRNFAPLPTEL